jgi:hypothetical protein
MTAPRWAIRNRFARGTLTSAGAVALVAVGVPAAALATHPASQPTSTQAGGGYPPPGGIYTPFTDCPILNPLMQETQGGRAVLCAAGIFQGGSITLGTITTPVTKSMDVQFGAMQLPNASLGGDWTQGLSSYAGGFCRRPRGGRRCWSPSRT